MLMGTLELPRRMIDAAKSYAERENLTVADLFAELLHSRFWVLDYPDCFASASPHTEEKSRQHPRFNQVNFRDHLAA